MAYVGRLEKVAESDFYKQPNKLRALPQVENCTGRFAKFLQFQGGMGEKLLGTWS